MQMEMKKLFVFGPFELDPSERILRREGSPVVLSPKAFDALVVLALNAGRLVEKERLLAAVWPGVHVQEAVVHRTMSDLRKALRQSDQEPWIETIPKFGYRLTVAVVGAVAEPDTAIGSGGNSSSTSTSNHAARVKAASQRAIVTAAAVAAVLALAGWAAVRGVRHPKPEAPPVAEADAQVLRIAILPFHVVGAGQPADASAMGVGLADDLITLLSPIRTIAVRSLSLVRRYHEIPGGVDPLRAGRELAVDLVLEGTLRIEGRTRRANVRLLRVKDGSVHWSGTVTAPPPAPPRGTDTVAAEGIEDAIVRQLAVNLDLRLAPARASSINPDAHELYNKGRYEWGKRTRGGFEKALELFRRAIDLDPSYARAHAGIADCYLLLGGYGHQAQLQSLPKAKERALRALELDPSLAEAHATLGLVAQNLDWSWEDVERHYRRAIELQPHYATAHHWYAEFLSIAGRFEESAREFALARNEAPVSSIIAIDEAQLYFFRRDFTRSRQMLEDVLRGEASSELARERLAWLALAADREGDAEVEASRLASCGAQCRLIWTAWLARTNPAASREALGALEAQASAGRAPLFALVVGYARHGQPERAIDWLERMADTRAIWLITAKVNPLFDPLRGSPRFAALLRRLRLA